MVVPVSRWHQFHYSAPLMETVLNWRSFKGNNWLSPKNVYFVEIIDSSAFEIVNVQLTWVERERVNKGPRNLFRGSLVPQGKVIAVKHPLFVFSRQKVSWSRRETELMKKKTPITIYLLIGTINKKTMNTCTAKLRDVDTFSILTGLLARQAPQTG